MNIKNNIPTVEIKSKKSLLNKHEFIYTHFIHSKLAFDYTEYRLSGVSKD